MADERGWTRRQLVGVGLGATVAGLVRGTETSPPQEEERSRVVLVRRPDVVRDDGSVDGSVLATMLDEAVVALFGVESSQDAWRRVVGPSDVVGIKSNVWSHLPTPEELETVLVRRVVAAGVSRADVAVDDRGVRANPVFERATALINVRPMRTHHWSGLGTCLKNMIMFVPRPPEYHGDSCATLGAIWHLPEVKGKVRLNILVMLTPQFHSVGPHGYSPRYVWTYGGLLVGRQPVPVDATGARIIQAKRDRYFGESRPISPSPHHIEVADTRYGLGPSSPERIELVRLGWAESVLI